MWGKRFTIGTITVVVHGVKQNTRWVRRVRRGPHHRYQVEVDDQLGTARSANVTIKTNGPPRHVSLTPKDPTTLNIPRFLSRPERVGADLDQPAPGTDGHQDIDIDVTVDYPTQSYTGQNRNRVRVKC